MSPSTSESPLEDPATQVPAAPTPAPTDQADDNPPAGVGNKPSKPPVPIKAPTPGEPLPIRMLHDRVLVKLDAESAERRSAGGILIPVTAEVGRRMSWAWVMATGQHVRQVSVGDRVLFDPQERMEVELQGIDYILLRERDIHAVARPDVEVHGTGLYL